MELCNVLDVQSVGDSVCSLVVVLTAITRDGNRDNREFIVTEVIVQRISRRKMHEKVSGITWCGMEVIFEKRTLSGDF